MRAAADTTTPMAAQNRTGLATSPDDAAELVAATQQTTPSQEGSEAGLAEVRISYAREGEAIGSMPPPPTLKGMAKSTLKLIQGKNANVLLDKMGERLAFERTGARLYEALLSKFDAYGSWPGGPERQELEQIHDEERSHFLMLKTGMESLGGDPTAVTPSANVHAVASIGLPAVLADPRTNLRQCMEVILHAELVDNDCWENLSDLALAVGVDDLADAFEQALDQEREHLRLVRWWVGTSLSGEASGKMTDSFSRRADARSAASATGGSRELGGNKSSGKTDSTTRGTAGTKARSAPTDEQGKASLRSAASKKPMKVPGKTSGKTPSKKKPGKNTPGKKTPGKTTPGKTTPGKKKPGRQ